MRWWKKWRARKRLRALLVCLRQLFGRQDRYTPGQIRRAREQLNMPYAHLSAALLLLYHVSPVREEELEFDLSSVMEVMEQSGYSDSFYSGDSGGDGFDTGGFDGGGTDC